MNGTSRKYESQLHLGLMAIIVVLLLLCTGSNYVIYRQRGVERERVEQTLQSLCTKAAVELGIKSGCTPANEQIESVRLKLNLTRLSIMPARISLDTSGNWSLLSADSDTILGRFNFPSALTLVPESIDEIQHGDGDEYLMLTEIGTSGGYMVVVAGSRFHEYQLLCVASDILFYASLAGLLLLGILYFTVTRLVTEPFERLKKNARQAGRVGDESTDIDTIIADYEKLVTELRTSQAELLELSNTNQQRAETLEHFSRYLLKSLVSGVITLDAEGDILSINESAATMLAGSSPLWVGRNLSELPFQYRAIVDMVSDTTLRGKSGHYKEISISTYSSVPTTLGVTISLVYDSERNHIGYTILLNDLGEVGRLREELQKREQLAALGEMAGGLAHQLRNSLGSARGYTRLVEKKIASQADCRDSLSNLTEELRLTELLVGRFLDFARPLTINAELLSIQSLIEGIIEGFRVRTDCRSISFNLSTDKNYFVSADGLLFRQAITNLIENSVKSYHDKPGCVKVRTWSEEDSVIVEISDEGDGIDTANLSRVFTPFFTTRTDGTGLGLPLAKKIIDLHDGKLTLRSERGKGTIARVSLPISNEMVLSDHLASVS